MMWLPNTAENLVVQLAASLSGLTVVTVKEAGQIEKLEQLGCKGIITSLENHLSSGKTAPAAAVVPPILTGTEKVSGNFLRYDELSMGPLAAALGDAGRGGVAAQYCYGSVKPVSEEALLGLGLAAANTLQLNSGDRVCLPITLSHGFGFGSGALAVLSRGAALVLPSATPCAEATQLALEDGCSVLYADSHTLAAMDGIADHRLPTLRTGLVKIGSGDAIGLGEPRPLGGSNLVTVGKPSGV